MFGDKIPQIPIADERIKRMWQMYGKGTKTCQTCVHLLRRKRNITYLKCDLNKITNGAGTDWRARWVSCGKYEERNATQ